MAMTLDGTNGVFLPTWTTATRPASPSNGEIGYNSTTGQLDQYVGGAWSSIPTGSASAATPTALGTVYGSTASGASETTALGYQAFNASSTGTLNTAVGYQALLANTSGNNNTAVGEGALTANTTGSENVSVGLRSLYTNQTGSFNTAVGRDSLRVNTGGSNTALGYQSLYQNSSGYSNTCVGYQSGYSTTTDFELTAIGWKAAYSNTTGSGGGRTTAIGTQALESCTSYYNTAVGWRSLQGLTTGTYNTAMGILSGNTLTTGDGNVYFGYNARASSSSVGNELVFGYNLVGQGGATASIGDNIGKVYVNFRSSGTWTQTSDGRLKQNINPDTLGLSFICRLNPVTYKWKPSNEIDQSLPYYSEENNRDTETVMHGLIAQEVKAALDAEGVDSFEGWKLGIDGVQNISREMFVTPLIKAIQELKSIVDAQAAEIAELKAK